MPKSKLVIAGIAMIVAWGVVSAQEAPKWGYIEAGYVDFDPDSGESDSGGFAGASMNLFRNFHLFAEYNDAGDFTFWNAGFGWHGLFGDPGDLFAEVVWNDIEVDSPSGSASDDGYEVSGGVRWKLGKWFDVKGQVNWIDLDQGGDDTTFEVEGLLCLLDDRLGLGVGYETGDADTMRAFARWSFGR